MRFFPPRYLQWVRSPQAWVFILAVGLGATAAAVSYSAQTQERSLLKESLIQSEGLVEVVVAGRPLPRNHLVQEEDLAVRLLPQQWLHADQLSPDVVDRVIGSRLMRDIASGVPVSITDTQPDNVPPKSVTVRAGYRLMSLPVDEASSVSGLIRPGHWIDLWASAPIAAAGDTAVSSPDIQVLQASVVPPALADLVASAVRVVAVGGELRPIGVQEEGSGPVRYGSLTIEIPADRVAALLTAQARGRLIALLRSDVVAGSHGVRTQGSTGAQTSSRRTQVEVIVHSQGGQS
nr:hypothetical protein NCPCFENI_00413 [Cupriavidus sp.]